MAKDSLYITLETIFYQGNKTKKKKKKKEKRKIKTETTTRSRNKTLDLIITNFKTKSIIRRRKSASKQKRTSYDRPVWIKHGHGGGDAIRTLIKQRIRENTFTKAQSKPRNKETIKDEKEQYLGGRSGRGMAQRYRAYSSEKGEEKRWREWLLVHGERMRKFCCDYETSPPLGWREFL